MAENSSEQAEILDQKEESISSSPKVDEEASIPPPENANNETKEENQEEPAEEKKEEPTEEKKEEPKEEKKEEPAEEKKEEPKEEKKEEPKEEKKEEKKEEPKEEKKEEPKPKGGIAARMAFLNQPQEKEAPKEAPKEAHKPKGGIAARMALLAQNQEKDKEKEKEREQQLEPRKPNSKMADRIALLNQTKVAQGLNDSGHIAIHGVIPREDNPNNLPSAPSVLGRSNTLQIHHGAPPPILMRREPMTDDPDELSHDPNDENAFGPVIQRRGSKGRRRPTSLVSKKNPEND